MADDRDAAYALGLASKGLTARLLRAAEADPSVMDAWREGKADRPDDQPDTAGGSPARKPARKAPAKRPTAEDRELSRRAPREPAAVARDAARAAGRGATGLLRRRRVSPAEFLLGLGTWAVVLNGIRYGPAGVTAWFRAKWLNQPMAATPSSKSSAPQQPESVNAAGDRAGQQPTSANAAAPSLQAVPPPHKTLRPVA
jgi:hypothetical protein